VNFRSSAYDQTSGTLLMGRLSVVWESRVWVSKIKDRDMPKSVRLLSGDLKQKYRYRKCGM